MGDQFIGKWNLVHSDNFDEFLKALGVSWLTRKAACSSSPSLEFSKNPNGSWQMKTESVFKTSIIVFTLDTEFEEQRVDSEKVKTTFTLEGDVLMQMSKGSVDYSVAREVANDVLKATAKAKDKSGKEVISIRLYKKAH